MNHQAKLLSTGQVIDIFDDVFSFKEMSEFYIFIQSSYYKLGSRATEFVDTTGYTTNWQSQYNPDDINKLGFFNNPKLQPMSSVIGNRERLVSWVNCFIPSTYVAPHCDAIGMTGVKTFMYYVNTEWKKEQGGETLFYNSNMDPEVIVEFKPNRIVIFDSETPHKPLQHFHSPYPYRFTFVSVFK